MVGASALGSVLPCASAVACWCLHHRVFGSMGGLENISAWVEFAFWCENPWICKPLFPGRQVLLLRCPRPCRLVARSHRDTFASESLLAKHQLVVSRLDRQHSSNRCQPRDSPRGLWTHLDVLRLLLIDPRRASGHSSRRHDSAACRVSVSSLETPQTRNHQLTADSNTQERPSVLKHILIRAVKVVAVLVLSALIGTTGLLVWLLLDHSRETMLPAPTGTYKVGRVTYDWTDAARLNRYAPVPGTKPELAVWLWYPAAVTPSSQPAEYLPKYWRNALEHHQGVVLTRLLSRDLSRVRSHSWSEHCCFAAEASVSRNYPASGRRSVKFGLHIDCGGPCQSRLCRGELRCSLPDSRYCLS